jgi:hypothetical protein
MVILAFFFGMIGPSQVFADLEVISSGDVGIGTSTPTASLEVSRSNGTATIKVDENSSTVVKRQMFILENNGGVSFRFIDRSADRQWTFATTDNPPVGEFVLNDPISPGREFFLDAGGNGIFEGSVSATAFNTISDRNLKEKVELLDGQEVLRKVMELPISRWSFKDDSKKLRHIGPMAQDFHALFEVGSDNRHISVTDASGIALAAIQGLGERMKAEDTQIQEKLKVKDAQIEELQRELAELRNLVQQLSTENQTAMIE